MFERWIARKGLMCLLIASLLMSFSGTASFGADLCLAPSDQNGLNGTADCDVQAPLLHDNSWTGFSTSGGPCTSADGGAIARCNDPTPFGYGYTISSSTTDPDATSGPLAAGQPLYLWLRCAPDGASAAEMGFAGSITVTDVTPIAPLLVIWIPPNTLLMAYDCWTGSFPLARLSIDTPTAVEPETWGQTKARFRQ